MTRRPPDPHETPQPFLVDQDGKPMTLMAWAEAFEDYDSRLLARDRWSAAGVEHALVTVWAGDRSPEEGVYPFGTAHRCGDGPMIELEQYDTRQAALDGHGRHLARLRRQGSHPGK